MFFKSIYYATAVAVFIAFECSPVLSAEVIVFDSSFRTADGFVDGDIGFVGPNPNTIVGQGGFAVVDSGSNGTLAWTGSAFQRALFGWPPDAGLTEADILGFAAGSKIEVTATGLTFNPTGSNLGVIGISNVDDTNILGGSSLAMGVQFTSNGTNIFLDRNTAFTATNEVDTGIGNGTSFDYRQVITATGSGVYDIEHFINGSLLTTSVGVSPEFGKSGTATAGHIQDFGQAGAITVDGLSLSYDVVAVPEPSSFAALLIFSASAIRLRQRKHAMLAV